MSSFFERPFTYVPYDPRDPRSDIRYYLPPPEQLEEYGDRYALKADAVKLELDRNPGTVGALHFSARYVVSTLVSEACYWMQRHSAQYEEDVRTYETLYPDETPGDSL